MPTLRDLMGDKTRGDGTRYRRTDWGREEWFEPIFYVSNSDKWYGMTQDGRAYFPQSEEVSNWETYVEPKKKKKVKMYRAILNESKSGDYWSDYQWYSDKKYSPQSRFCDVVAWQEMEIEVTDE